MPGGYANCRGRSTLPLPSYRPCDDTGRGAHPAGIAQPGTLICCDTRREARRGRYYMNAIKTLCVWTFALGAVWTFALHQREAVMPAKVCGIDPEHETPDDGLAVPECRIVDLATEVIDEHLHAEWDRAWQQMKRCGCPACARRCKGLYDYLEAEAVA